MTKRYARIAGWRRAVADRHRYERGKRRKRQPPAGRPVSAAGRPAPSPSREG